jgi:nucleolar protein 12
MSSLVGSIFGSVEPSSGLLNVFEASSTSPRQTPTQAPASQEETEEEVEEPISTSDEAGPDKKKRKRNKDDQGKDSEDTENKDASAKNDGSNGESIENGESANEKEPPAADDRTIFVGNLPLDTTRNSLKSIFIKCGKVESTRLRSIATTGVKVAPEQRETKRWSRRWPSIPKMWIRMPARQRKAMLSLLTRNLSKMHCCSIIHW